MDITIISFTSIALYLLAGLIAGLHVFGQIKSSKIWILLLGFLAICLHGLVLHEWIDMSVGQNLNFFNMFSLAVWLVSLFILVMIVIRPIEVLALLVYPIAALSILFVLVFPRTYIVHTAANSDTLFHIILSIFTFCVLCVAGLLAILLAIQDRLLRSKKFGQLISHVPPLEAMEFLLFQMIGLGFILLSVVLVTSIYFYHAILFQHIVIIQKTIIVIAAWIVFAVLLTGRFMWGWRGRKAIYCTLGGVLLLFIAYFGSKFVLEALT